MLELGHAIGLFEARTSAPRCSLAAFLIPRKVALWVGRLVAKVIPVELKGSEKEAESPQV